MVTNGNCVLFSDMTLIKKIIKRTWVFGDRKKGTIQQIFAVCFINRFN